MAVLWEVLSHLPPVSLCKMACVCKELRRDCRSDHLWKTHFENKWARVVGSTFPRWQFRVILIAEQAASTEPPSRISEWALSRSWLNQQNQPLAVQPPDSYMAWYWALESGSLWFPAQVYNRENENPGYMLSCFDAQLNYDRRTNTFKARYAFSDPQSGGAEEGIPWERVRAPPVYTPGHVLYQSDCLPLLRPGNHVEVQWRANRDLPFGWWYGRVGHSEACEGNDLNCRCGLRETIWLEFNHYAVGSRWQRAAIDRTSHQEAGSEIGGYYGGIRKLETDEEIAAWNQFFPREPLE